MNIYFSGSIAGGRQKQEFYKELIRHCKQYGIVYNQCVGKRNIRVHKSMNIYERNMDWIDKCDVFIAEVSVPSLGVGMEIEHAIQLKPEIPVLCLFDMTMTKPTSKMLTNCKHLNLIGYATPEIAKEMITKFLELYFGDEILEHEGDENTERDDDDVDDEEDTIPGHPNCHYGECYSCHDVTCLIHEGYEEVPAR